MADGVLGEFVVPDIKINAANDIELNELVWKPLRYGEQLWDIGIPNRTATEFFMADNFRDTEISYKYAELFPDDITYVIGESDFRKDWFFQHVPHNEDPEAKSRPFFGASSPGRATPYTIIFNLDEKPQGTAVLRFAICGTGARSLDVTVNGKNAGSLRNLPGDGVITRHGIQGIWYERKIEFDASMMNKGRNELILTIPAGNVNNGLVYDYIRMEIY